MQILMGSINPFRGIFELIPSNLLCEYRTHFELMQRYFLFVNFRSCLNFISSIFERDFFTIKFKQLLIVSKFHPLDKIYRK